MKGFVSSAVKAVGIDRAIAYTLIGRGWSALSGPITLLFIVRYLTTVEQGFYYTFGSVLGLQVLFELGLTYVIFQIASHEKAKLEWTHEGRLAGDADTENRVFSLLRKAMVWYVALSLLVFAAMIPGGLLFFEGHQGKGAHVSWQLPWIWVVTATAFDLISSPIVAIIEGSGKVAEVASVRAFQVIVGSVLTWLVLMMNGRLFASPVSNTVVLVGWWVWLLTSKRGFVTQAITHVVRDRGIDWRREVWPFQWKIAVSGICSYFIFIIFTPILFMFRGAVVAGQMGMSMAVMNAIGTIAITWASTKLSPFGTLIAQRKFKELDALFFPSLWRSLGVLVVLASVAWLADLALNLSHSSISLRLLAPLPLGILLGTTVVNHIVNVEAMYLRAHKEEPFLVLSVVVAVLTATTSYFIAQHNSVTVLLAANFLVTVLFSLGWGTYIFLRKRELWRRDSSTVASVTL